VVRIPPASECAEGAGMTVKAAQGFDWTAVN
jgi:hypothetical protein